MQVRWSYPFLAAAAMVISSSSRFLGSAGGFEECAKFCYNTIITHNLVLLQWPGEVPAAGLGSHHHPTTRATASHLTARATRPRSSGLGCAAAGARWQSTGGPQTLRSNGWDGAGEGRVRWRCWPLGRPGSFVPHRQSVSLVLIFGESGRRVVGGTVEAVMFRMGGSVAHRQLLQTEWLVGSCCRPSGSPSRCGWTHIVRPYSGGCDVQLRRDWVTESQSIASALWSTFHPRYVS
jgi:hypothetical protein